MILNEFLEKGLGIKPNHAVRMKVGRWLFDKFKKQSGRKPDGRKVIIKYRGEKKGKEVTVADYPSEFLWDNAVMIFVKIFADQAAYYGNKTALYYHLIPRVEFNYILKKGHSMGKKVHEINEHLCLNVYVPLIEKKIDKALIVKSAPKTVMRKRKKRVR